MDGMAELTRRRGRLIPPWARTDHPVYWLETRRAQRSRGLRGLQLGCLPAMLAMGALAVTIVLAVVFAPQVYSDMETAISGALGILMAVLVLIQIGAGAAASILLVAQVAPAISGEVELRSWGLLRSTTLPLREIMLAKLAAVFTQMRGALIGLLALRAASTVTGWLLIGYLLRESFYYDPTGGEEFFSSGQWIMPGLALLLFTIWYLTQPAVQFALNGAIALLASASARSRARAIAGALAARLAGWVLSVLLNGGLIYGLGYLIIANWASPYSAPLRAFRDRPMPSDETIAFVLGGTAALYVLSVLVAQLGLTAGALALAQRIARRLGG